MVINASNKHPFWEKLSDTESGPLLSGLLVSAAVGLFVGFFADLAAIFYAITRDIRPPLEGVAHQQFVLSSFGFGMTVVGALLFRGFSHFRSKLRTSPSKFLFGHPAFRASVVSVLLSAVILIPCIYEQFLRWSKYGGAIPVVVHQAADSVTTQGCLVLRTKSAIMIMPVSADDTPNGSTQNKTYVFEPQVAEIREFPLARVSAISFIRDPEVGNDHNKKVFHVCNKVSTTW